MSEDISTYRGREIDVTCDRKRCIHAAECGKGNSEVFNPKNKPWIAPDKAPADEVAAIVARCPAGALQFTRNDGGAAESIPARNTVTVAPDGPLYVRGQVVIRHCDGTEEPVQTRLALCRCGASSIKPYCDGSHGEAGFRDTGSVNGDPSDQPVEGGALTLSLLKDGPILIGGPVTVHAASGRAAFVGSKGAFCRCGASTNKPFCDGSHKTIGFKAP